ncbi:hypothetical protein ACTFIW_007047 [Dictyostelium discoideum]
MYLQSSFSNSGRGGGVVDTSSSSSSSSSSSNSSPTRVNNNNNSSNNNNNNNNNNNSNNIPNNSSTLYRQNLYELPTNWSSKEKCSHLELSSNSLRVTYKNNKTDNEAGLIRANCCIPPSCGIYYFEITVISKGRDGYIGIGVCTSTMLLSRLPGWERNSFGYHGDDGNLFKGSGTGISYGPTYTTGDVVGCCINFVQGAIFFTKNGVPLGEATKEIKGLSLYPCVGLRTPGESLEANFGQRPFAFDVDQLFKEEKQRVIKTIKNTKTVEDDSISTQLVLSYLMHHGYSETVKLFAKATGTDGDSLNSQLDDIKNRQRISELLSKGNIDEVIKELDNIYPNFLTQNRDIQFKLLCQKFIEMIKTSPIEETMAFGQNQLSNFSFESKECESNLNEIFSLIAYSDPYTSPVSFLLEKSKRDQIINDLNCALLVYCHKPATPVLEKIVKQAKVAIDQVVYQNASPAAAFVNVKDFIDVDDN